MTTVLINPVDQTIVLVAETAEDKAYLQKQLPESIRMVVGDERFYVSLRYT